MLREALKISSPLAHIYQGKCHDFTAGHSGTLHLQLPPLDMPLAAAAAAATWSVHSFRQKILYAAMPIHVYIEK